jgi:hypothetical protein
MSGIVLEGLCVYLINICSSGQLSQLSRDEELSVCKLKQVFALLWP